MIDISIVIPAMRPGYDFLRCVASIRACLIGKVSYEIICIVPDISTFDGVRGDDIVFLNEASPGIYPAMNQGLRMASGQYVYFSGQDDILLPPAADAVISGRKREADLIVSDVFWGGRGIFKNARMSGWLVFRNWCHQGVIYNRQRFLDLVVEFPGRFTVQADHYANIVFSTWAGGKVVKHPECIAWYASVGFSSVNRDVEFRREFPGIVRKYFGLAAYIFVVFRRALLSIAKLARIRK